MSTGVFVALEKHALHHPDVIPRWLRWLDFDWPQWITEWRLPWDMANVWRKSSAKQRDGRCVESDETGRISGTPDVSLNAKAFSTPLTIMNNEDIANDQDDDEEPIVHANCVSITADVRKASSPKVIRLASSPETINLPLFSCFRPYPIIRTITAIEPTLRHPIVARFFHRFGET